MPALNFLAQVVPSTLTAGHFAYFDEQIAHLTLELMTLPGRSVGPACSEDRITAFRRRLRLPTFFNGAGLTGVDGVAPAAFIASVAAAAGVDPTLKHHIDGLERFALPALHMLQARLAPLGPTRVQALLRLPALDPLDIFDQTRYVEQDADEETTAPKLQWKWSREIHKAASMSLKPLEHALGDSDLVHSEARARPVPLILDLPLSNPFFRFSPAEFISWFRFQFRIPQLPRLGNPNAQGVEQCLANCRRRDIDLHGNHAHSGKCRSTLRGRGLRHTNMKGVVSHHAAKAGCMVKWVTEDSTEDMLLQQYSAGQCSTMFPLSTPAKLAEEARRLQLDLRAACGLPPDQQDKKRPELAGRLLELMDQVKNGRGLRLDGTITHLASNQQVWYDVTATHSTAYTLLKQELKLTRERLQALQDGKDVAGMCSAALLGAYHDKLDRYALLAAIVERQVLDKVRSSVPLILPVVATTHGEFCPGALQLQEWLVEKYRARLHLEGERDDGVEIQTLTAAFRRDFRQSMLVAVCKGMTAMLAAAGLPFHRRGQSSSAPPRAAASSRPASRAARRRSSGSSSDSSRASDSGSRTS